MSDDLIERLRECAECKSSEAWGRLDGGQDLCIGAALATEAADELARLRAEVERLKADGQRIMNEAVKMLNEDASDYNRKTNAMIERHADQVAQLTAALSDERAHADAMAEALGQAVKALEMVTDQNAIKSTSVANAFAACVEAASIGRKALLDQNAIKNRARRQG